MSILSGAYINYSRARQREAYRCVLSHLPDLLSLERRAGMLPIAAVGV
jgi:hypothetical protein